MLTQFTALPCRWPLAARKSLLVLCGAWAVGGLAAAEPAKANEDESKVPAYTLPDPLVLKDGQPVRDAATWTQRRRPELLELFRSEVYGRVPPGQGTLRYEVTSTDATALAGKARRKQVAVWPTGDTNGPRFDLLLYVPKGAARVPVFLGLNFQGNHAVHADPGIALNPGWLPAGEGVVEHRATAAARGTEARRWAVEKILARGYGLATVYYGDFEPDFAEGWKTGVRAALSPDGTNTLWAPDAWGAIATWAWGLSRTLDYLERDADVDARRVVVLGHSRLGKTALWAGAEDQRFAAVISNNSGEGGAALARRRFGETTAIINRVFPHWFCGKFKTYADREDALPVDQHELLALIAPRPVYVASAAEDLWADPRGEFLAALHASPVYELLGRPGLRVTEMPATNQPVGHAVAYHVRTGKHDVTDYDWDRYLDFADRQLRHP